MKSRPPALAGIGNSRLQPAKFLTLLFCLLFATSVFSEIKVGKIVAGLDGYVRGERWAPVTIEVENTGEDFIGSVQILKGETIFQKSLHLSSGSAKKIEILYYHSNYYESLSYRIVDQQDRIVLKNRIDVRPLNYMDNLLLVISNRGYSHQFLNGTQNPWSGKTFVAYLRPDELYDEPIAYSAADSIAIGDLSPAEAGETAWKALLQAIASGGILVASPGTNVSALQDPLLRGSLPVISRETQLMSNGAFLLAKWTSRSSDPFPVFSIPLQTITLRPCDRSLINYPDPYTTLVSSSPYSKGNIVYFSYDYTRLPEQINLLFANYWNEIIFHPGSGIPMLTLPFRKRLEENPRIQKFLNDVPGLQLPDVKWFALFFFIYLCAIGPLQYAVLRLIRKSGLLWLTFPLIILLFSLASFGYSTARHSSDSRIMQVSVTEIFPLLRQQTIYQVYGLATSESGTFNFQAMPENSFLRKSGVEEYGYAAAPYKLSEDLPRQLLGESLKRWTFRTFDAIATQPASTHFPVQVSIKGEMLTGSFTNGSSEDLQDAFFYYDDRNAARIGSIPAGATKQFEIRLNDTSIMPFSVAHLRDLLNLYNASWADAHFIFGEIAHPEGSLRINGREQKTKCLRYLAVYVDVKDARPLHGWVIKSPS